MCLAGTNVFPDFEAWGGDGGESKDPQLRQEYQGKGAFPLRAGEGDSWVAGL